MKLPRRRYWVPLVLLCSLLAFVRFQPHYQVLGWFRGDAYFQGLPTSYWRDSATRAVRGGNSWIDNLHRMMRLKSPGARSSAIFNADPESANVIVQILTDKSVDAAVRETLLGSLRSWPGDPPEALLDAVRPYLEDSSEHNRHSAGCILLKWEDDGTVAAKTLVAVYETWSKHASIGFRSGTAEMLYHAAIRRKDVDIQPFLNLLHVLEQDTNPIVRQAASESLARIRRARQLEP